MKKIIILGAGLTGLSTAFHLEKEKNELKSFDYEIYEKENKAGGLCRTEEKNGCFFDYSGHLLHFKNEYAKNLVESLLKKNLRFLKRDARVYLKNRYIKYPFQANLDTLPDEIKNKCLNDFCIASRENKNKKNCEFSDFEEWIFGRFGEGIAKYFMIPFNRKLWRNDLKEISCKWVDEFIPVPESEEISEKNETIAKKDYGYNITFFYPEKGGIQVLPDAFLNKIKSVNLRKSATKIDIEKKIVKFNNGEKIKYDVLVSTIPLKELVKKIINLPEKIKKTNNSLKYTSVLIINLGIKNKNSSMHWVYVPEEKYPFYRFGYFSNFSENMAPKGRSSIYCEVSYKGGDNIDVEKIQTETINGLINIGVVKDKSEIIEEKTLIVDYAYVIYNKEREKLTEEIQSFLKNHSIFSIGRYGKWEYSSMEDAIVQGKETANYICGEGF